MGHKSKGGAGKKKGKGSRAPASSASAPPRLPHHNFVADAGPGCVIAHDASPPWALGRERIDPRDYPRDVVFPDLAVNPEDRTLSVVNASSRAPRVLVTVYDHPVLDRDGVAFPSGRAVDDDGHERACVTFILLLPPGVILHAATLSEPTSEIDSDVQDWSRHPDPEDTHPAPLGFPLGGDGPWLCTQGEGGALTHFFSGNLHAVDFRCDVGTDILAVADGEVLEAPVPVAHRRRRLQPVRVEQRHDAVRRRRRRSHRRVRPRKKRQRGGQGGGHGATRTKSVRERGGGIQPGAPPAFHRVSNQRRGRGDVSRSVRSRRRRGGTRERAVRPRRGKWYDARGERPTPGTEARGADA